MLREAVRKTGTDDVQTNAPKIAPMLAPKTGKRGDSGATVVKPAVFAIDDEGERTACRKFQDCQKKEPAVNG